MVYDDGDVNTIKLRYYDHFSQEYGNFYCYNNAIQYDFDQSFEHTLKILKQVFCIFSFASTHSLFSPWLIWSPTQRVAGIYRLCSEIYRSVLFNLFTNIIIIRYSIDEPTPNEPCLSKSVLFKFNPSETKWLHPHIYRFINRAQCLTLVL